MGMSPPSALALRVARRYQADTSPFAEFATPEDVETLRTFTRRLSFWMGMSRSITLTELYSVWKKSPLLQRWLRKHINPASVAVFHGKRWETTEPLPALGTPMVRKYKALQWSKERKTAEWFAGLTGTYSTVNPEWVGGVLTGATASNADIIVDIDALSRFCGQHRAAYEAIEVNTDALAMFNGTQWEGEVLTTVKVQGTVIRAEMLPRQLQDVALHQRSER